MDLRGQIDKFYEEMNKGESWELGWMGAELIPKMDYRIEKLEKENELLYGKLNMINDIIESGGNQVE